MKDKIKRLKQLDTASVSDAMDRVGVSGGLLGIKPVAGSDKVICGEAFTVHYIPCGQKKGIIGDFLDEVEEGQVVVIDNAGRDYCVVWGDIMTYVATQKGIEATVIDGVCRDMNAVKILDYPIYSKGYYMVTGKGRIEIDGVNIPVSISNVKVCPGDIIFGDSTGCVAIPRERLDEVLEVAEEIEYTERKIIEALENGLSLKEARRKTGYHKLHTKNRD